MSAKEAVTTLVWGSPNHARFRQRDQVLVRLAEQLMQDQGLVSFRFSELAPLAGCSAGTLYKHFASKEDLLIAILARHLERLVECQPHLMTCELSFVERWIAMHLLAVAASRQCCWSLSLNSIGSSPKLVERASEYRIQELKMHLEQFYHAILRVVESARIQGELTATDQQVANTHAMMVFLERGAIDSIDNPLMENALEALDLRQLFEVFALYLNVLDWRTPLRPDSYERVMAEVEHQLQECQQQQQLLSVL